LVELRSSFDVEKCEDVIVELEIENEHFMEQQDWVGLYRKNFHDYR